MSLPVLYSFRRCPYAMRARMAIAAGGVSVELREILLRDIPDVMREASPKATVPVLVVADDKVIDESLDIMHWALGQNDPNGWLDEGTQSVCDKLLECNDGEFKYYLDRYKYADRYPEYSPAHYRGCAESFLSSLDKQLIESRFLCGDRVTVADVAIFPFVRQFSMVDVSYFDNLPLVRLQRWLEYFLDSDLFRSIMQKMPVWNPGDPVTVFPADST